MKHLRRLSLAALCALTPGLATAETPITYRDDTGALFAFNAPDFWSVRTGGERNVTPPDSDEARRINRVIGLEPHSDEGVWMGFMSPHGVRTYQDAVTYLQEIGRFIVTDPEVTDRKRVTIGGLPAAKFTGTGTRGLKGVAFTAVLIDLPGPRVAISLVVMEAGANPELVNDVNGVFASFRAIR